MWDLKSAGGLMTGIVFCLVVVSRGYGNYENGFVLLNVDFSLLVQDLPQIDGTRFSLTRCLRT